MLITKSRIILIACLLLVAPLLINAQATRTWVSGVGDDANPCSRTAPCKTWAGAISKTATGGEIDTLDPGGFGALTITKSITIDGGGGQVASALVSGTNGFTIALSNGGTVTLRNLRFQGIGGLGLDGISMVTGGVLNIDLCEISGFQDNGINITPDGGSAYVYINNTVSHNNGGAGLYVSNSGVAVNVSVANSHFINNQYGIWAADYAQVVATDTQADGNSSGGFVARGSAQKAQLAVVNSTGSFNGIAGAIAGGSGKADQILLSNVFLMANPLPTKATSPATITGH